MTRVAAFRCRAVSASASSVDTPTTGSPAPRASPCATPQAIRSPVNAPGPAPNAKPSSRASVAPWSIEQSANHRQQQLGVTVPGDWRALVPRDAIAERDRADFRRGVDERGFASAHFTVPGRRDVAPARAGTMIDLRRFGAARRWIPSSSPRSIRKAAASHASTARRCSSKAHWSASSSRSRSIAAKPTYELARTIEILRASPSRVAPLCPHFGVCGGCSLQHAGRRRRRSPPSSACSRMRFWHIGRVRPRRAAGADSRTDMGVPAARAAVGSRRAQEGWRAGRLPRAEVELRHRHALLPGAAAAHFRRCSRHCGSWSAACRCAIACRRSSSRCGDEADDGTGDEVLVLSQPRRAPAADERALAAFADRHGVRLYLQPSGPASVQALHPSAAGP